MRLCISGALEKPSGVGGTVSMMLSISSAAMPWLFAKPASVLTTPPEVILRIVWLKVSPT